MGHVPVKALFPLVALCLGLAACATPQKIAQRKCEAKGYVLETAPYRDCWDRQVRVERDRERRLVAALTEDGGSAPFHPVPTQLVLAPMAMPSAPAPAPAVGLPYPITEHRVPHGCIGTVRVGFDTPLPCL
jgi:hypothetical protein